MVTPLVHMGLGYDDLLVPALVHAGFETKDLILVVRTDANLAWVRKHAPRATTVRLPSAAARKANVVSGLAPHAALKRACAGVGLDPLDLLVSERALRRNRVDTAMNFLNLAAEELEAAIEGRGPVLALVEFTVTSELLQSERFKHLLARLGSMFDLIVIDSPPTVPVTDAAILSTLVDGFAVARAATRMRKELKVIILSGRENDGRGFPLVRKPFLLGDLRRTMEQHTGPC